MGSKKEWVVRHIMMIRSREDIKDGLYGFRERVIESKHISKSIAKQAAMNIATEFHPDNGDHDNFDNMTNVKDQRVQVVHRTTSDDLVEEIKYEKA